MPGLGHMYISQALCTRYRLGKPVSSFPRRVASGLLMHNVIVLMPFRDDCTICNLEWFCIKRRCSSTLPVVGTFFPPHVRVPAQICIVKK